MKPAKLFRTTVVFWTEYDPSAVELEDLARECTTGEGFATEGVTEEVTDPAQFPDTEFFDIPED